MNLMQYVITFVRNAGSGNKQYVNLKYFWAKPFNLLSKEDKYYQYLLQYPKLLKWNLYSMVNINKGWETYFIVYYQKGHVAWGNMLWNIDNICQKKYI